MIIKSLADYYDTLTENDTENKIPKFGWSTAKVIGMICLDSNGNITNIISTMEQNEKKKKPTQMIVPEQAKRSVNIKPNFLCDGADYLLCYNNKNKNTLEKFYAAKKFHLQILSNIDKKSTIINGLIKFWENYDPEMYTEIIEKNSELLQENGNLIFAVNDIIAHTDDEIKKTWQNHIAKNEEATIMQCAITGQYAPTARIHPNIKGVRGAQSSGAALVSFNAPALESYGKEQSYNASMSEEVTFKYATALNHLINTSPNIYIGDTLILSWTKDDKKAYKNLFDQILYNDKIELNQNDLIQTLRQIVNGDKVYFDNTEIDQEKEFYILGISPNAARLSIRFFYKNNFGKIIQNILNHYERINIQKPTFETREYLSISNLMYETVNKKSKDKNASPILTRSLIKAVLNDTFYPQSLSAEIIMRIHVEKNISWGQAAILKAFLLKNTDNNTVKEICTMALNTESNFEPYVLGRLFSVLEEIQDNANGNTNSTIKNTYFTSAASTPGIIFPRLMQLSQAHLRKISSTSTGNKIRLEKKITELYSKLPEKLSNRLSLTEQQSFYLGYYHQNAKRYEKQGE